MRIRNPAGGTLRRSLCKLSDSDERNPENLSNEETSFADQRHFGPDPDAYPILGSVPLFNGSGWGSSDPYLCLTDPDVDPDPDQWFIYIIL